MSTSPFGPWRVAVAAWCVVLAGCGTGGIDAHWQKLDPRPEAANFTLPRLDGDPVELASLKGQVVVLDFWATWCGPCRQSLPSLEAIARKYRDRGVAVLLINQGEPAEQVRRWIERRYTAPILLDQRQEVAERYRISGIPATFVVDRDGRVAYAHSGYGGFLERNLTLILEELLAPPAGDAAPTADASTPASASPAAP